MAKSTTHILRASLQAKLYREIEIESHRSLRDLAEAIIGAFDFDFDHAFGFYSKLTGPYHQSPEQYELFADMEDADSDAESVERTKVAQVFATAGKKMLFLFDYGDEWRFQVELVRLGEKTPKTRYPKLLSTVGKAPPQYPDDDDEDE
jgi:Plasmid pRiA4b ORF-3-like protein